jgi:alpha-mannosidase
VKETCLVEPGSITDERPGKFGVKDWKTVPDTTPILFSYVMNNYWHTNFKAEQLGEATIHYALYPHLMYNLGEIQRNAMAFSQPFIPIADGAGEPGKSLFRITNPNIAVTFLEPTQKGYRLRLFNLVEAPEKFQIQWTTFNPNKIIVFKEYDHGEEVKPDQPVSLSGFGICEIEITRQD